jgi:hypothetical protein
MSNSLAKKRLAEAFVETAVALMKEYTEKLRQISASAHGLRGAWETHRRSDQGGDVRAAHDSLSSLYRKLSSPAGDLARAVSQMIEHGDLEDLSRLELRLRLAEFEHALMAGNDTLTATRIPA